MITTKKNGSMQTITDIEMAKLHGLPSGFTELEYIEMGSTNARISTGFRPNQNSRILIRYSLSTINTIARIPFGVTSDADTSDAMYGIYRIHASNNNKTAWGRGAGTNAAITNYNTAGEIYTIDVNKNVTSVNGNVVKTFDEQTWSQSRSVQIGCRLTGSSYSRYAQGARYYFCYMWDDGTLTKAFVPCKRDSDGTIGMYELVSDTMYEPVGQFLAGPEKTTSSIISVKTKVNNEMVELYQNML